MTDPTHGGFTDDLVLDEDGNDPVSGYPGNLPRTEPLGVQRARLEHRHRTKDENLEAVRWFIDRAVSYAYDAFYVADLADPAAPDDVPDPVDGMTAARLMVAWMFDALEGYNVRVAAAPREPIGSTLRRTVFERDRYRCRRCGSWVDLQIDHVIPHSKGGPTIEENLQALCRPCNARKHAEL